MVRDLFVFAGQSNMMGASVFPPKHPICAANSFEYKHKKRRLGAPMGEFVPAAHPAGEFSYCDLKAAYAPDMTDVEKKSTLGDYKKNTYFCPAMSNLKSEEEKTVRGFIEFSEASATVGASLPPMIAAEWEKRGGTSAYVHIAKGGVKIAYFFTDASVRKYEQRIKAYNEAHGTSYKTAIDPACRMPGAADYFMEKCKDFFADAEVNFANDEIKNRCFFWLQGEGDAWGSDVEYKMKLEVLWEQIKPLGFTHFFCIRVDFFGERGVYRVMKGAEQFTEETPDAYMLTRAASFLPYAGIDESDWFVTTPAAEYQQTRDSFFGFPNQHINEKGFETIAAHAVKNLDRILHKGAAPILEEENIRPLLKS